MHHSSEPISRSGENVNEQQLPLKLTAELWAGLTPAQQTVYRRAEALLDVLESTRQASIGDLIASGPGGEVLRALEVLEGMDLIRVDASEVGPLVRLVAVPADHIAIKGPDGRQRWVFIAQPLEPPEVDPARLN